MKEGELGREYVLITVTAGDLLFPPKTHNLDIAEYVPDVKSAAAC